MWAAAARRPKGPGKGGLGKSGSAHIPLELRTQAGSSVNLGGPIEAHGPRDHEGPREEGTNPLTV
jgi:hypothetical protein